MADYEYLQSAIPNQEAMARTIKLDWSGLNMTNKFESGELSDCNNISSDEVPYLSPCPIPLVKDIGTIFQENNTDRYIQYPLAVYSLNNDVYVLWFRDVGSLQDELLVKYYFTKLRRGSANGATAGFVFEEGNNTRVTYEYLKIKKPGATSVEQSKQLKYLQDVHLKKGSSITSFITYDGDLNATQSFVISPIPYGECNIYTDNERYYLNSSKRMFSLPSGFTGGNASYIKPKVGEICFPYITVNQSRVFGATEAIAGASGYMSYGDWETDLSYMTPTKDGYGANHAWISSLQSSDHSYSGEVTGIVSFGSRVIVFKADAMYEIVNTKNPFRIADVFNTGCIDGRSAKVVGGNLFFASEDGVYLYTGGKPECISRKLDIKRITSAVAGTDGKKYYLSCVYKNKKDNDISVLFVYDVEYGVWAKQDYKGDIIGMTYVDGHLYGIVNNSTVEAPGNADIVELNTENYDGQEWFAETDLMMNDTAGNYTVSPKRINKIFMLAEMNPASELEISVMGADEDYTDEDVVKKKYVNDSSETKTIPIRLNIKKKADYGLRVRVSGKGYSKVYSMEITYTDGGTLNVTDRDRISKP